MVWQGELAELKEKPSKAISHYINVLRFGDTLANERCLNRLLLKMPLEFIGLASLIRILSELSIAEESLRVILTTLIEYHGRDIDFCVMMEDYYQSVIMYNVADLVESKFEAVSSWDAWLESSWFSKYIYDYRYDVEKLRKALEIYRKVRPAEYWRLPPEVKDDDAFDKRVGLTYGELSLVWAMVLRPGTFTLCLAETEVLWRGAIALSGIRLFQAREGRLPENLGELGDLVPKNLLIDPFSGKNLVYRVEGADFYLYSVGVDGVDNRARDAVPCYDNEAWRGSIDIVFHAPAADKKDK
jgi:hypothetical protein